MNFDDKSDPLFIDEDILSPVSKPKGVVTFRSPSEPRSSAKRVSSPVQFRTRRARSSMPSPRTACEFMC